jgi:branched-chain amino acid transport system permease protein
VSLLISNLIQYLVGAENYNFPGDIYGTLQKAALVKVGDATIIIRTPQLIIIGVALVIVVGLTAIINRTRFGKALKAVAEDQTTASLLGINTDRFIVITFFISGLLGGVAGTLIAASSSIAGPYFGTPFGLKGLAVIVLGGMGEIPGAVAGGLLIGMAEALVPPEYSSYKDAVAFAILFLALLIRPQGLLGRVTVQKV